MTKFSYFLGSEQWQPEELLEHAQLARKAGFDMVTISEHFHPWVDDHSASNFTWATLGVLARELKNMDLGTGVTTPLWRIHPGVIAQACATIDRFTKSTFHLGVGTGENINEGPLGYEFPKYEERANRMKEALTIIKRLLSGEKLTFEGEYYNTNSAKLYTPPLKEVPIWLAAGGPKSATLAAEYADGLMISVKNPEDAYEKVINPSKQKSEELGKTNLRVHTYRWTMFADNDEDAWESLKSWRGLRAPNRLQELDPMVLRETADSLGREEIMSKFSRAGNIEELVNIYKPLVEDFESEIVTIQISSIDQPKTIELLGKELLPKLKK